jgi:hypothetical protein
MILSNKDIRLALKQGRLRITPLPEPDQFAPSALDLRVGNNVECSIGDWVLVMWKDGTYEFGWLLERESDFVRIRTARGGKMGGIAVAVKKVAIAPEGAE